MSYRLPSEVKRMAMSERVARLREESLKAQPTLSSERAELLTAFDEKERAIRSAPVRRALAFQHILENKTIWIGEDELIVGERGPRPKATPTYPELCCHSLTDLDILDTREKIPFRVHEETREVDRKSVV